MEVSLERINEDYLFEVTNSKGMSIHLDNNSKQNGEIKGLSPMELLLMGLAGCSSIDIIAILNKQKIKKKACIILKAGLFIMEKNLQNDLTLMLT